MMSMSMYRSRRRSSSSLMPPCPSSSSSSSSSSPSSKSAVTGPLHLTAVDNQKEVIVANENSVHCLSREDSSVLQSKKDHDSLLKEGSLLMSTDHEECRKAAINCLEEFFLGSSSSWESRQDSPVSVLKAPDTLQRSRHKPLRQMAGDGIPSNSVEDETSETILNDSEQHKGSVCALDDSGYDFIDDVLQPHDDECSISTMEHAHHFSKLTAYDRSHSLPLEYMSPTQRLSKKPSLKKISSIGKNISKKSLSEHGPLERTVSFSSLSIREYPPAISDNPSCSFGPPVQLDWDHHTEETQSIDTYEESRQPRRANHDLLLSYYDRRFLLLKQAGYSKREIKEAVQESDRVKRERMVTDMFLPVQKLDETIENVVDAVKAFFGKDTV